MGVGVGVGVGVGTGHVATLWQDIRINFIRLHLDELCKNIEKGLTPRQSSSRSFLEMGVMLPQS